MAQFLSASLNITKRVQQFFDNVNPDVAFKDIDFTNLFIQDKIKSAQQQPQTKQTTLRMTLDCSGISQPIKLSTRIITLASAEPITLGSSDTDNISVVHNLYFHHHSIVGPHAEFKLVNGSIFMRDLGSTTGTLINKIRIGMVGHTLNPLQIKNNDVVQFANLLTVITISNDSRNKYEVSWIHSNDILDM